MCRRLLAQGALKQAGKEGLDQAIKKFKKEMTKETIDNIHKHSKLYKRADVWTRNLSDHMTNFRYLHNDYIQRFLYENERDIVGYPMIFYNSIRLNVIKDMAVRIDDRRNLGQVRLFYSDKSKCCCKETDIAEWSYQNWLCISANDEELKIKVRCLLYTSDAADE